MDIAGKVFIVTGGASGLGEGTARMLARAGGKVVVADLQDDKGKALAAEIGGAFVHCDVSQEAEGHLLVRQTDAALYEAKAAGRNRTRLYGQVTEPTAMPLACYTANAHTS